MYFYEDQRNVELSGSLDYHPSEDTIICGLAEFADKEGTKTADYDPSFVQAWARSVKKEWFSFHSLLTSRGLARIHSNLLLGMSASERVHYFWLPAMWHLASPSSAGGWDVKFKLPQSYASTKAGIFMALLAGDIDWDEVFTYVDLVWRWLLTEGSGESGFPLHVFGKREPVPLKKLLEGRHRIISMPDPAIVIVEFVYSAYYDEHLRMHSLDDLLGAERKSKGGYFSWMYGGDSLAELSSLKRYEVILDGDISGWDHNVPLLVQHQIYECFVSDAVIARNLAVGQCGGGVFIYGKRRFRLPRGCAAWCSGALKTLSGNSFMHHAFLVMCGFDGIVMGDDVNVGCSMSNVEETEKNLRQSYAKVGLKLKILERKDQYSFCKSAYTDGRYTPDYDSILRKMLAKSQWPMTITSEQRRAICAMACRYGGTGISRLMLSVDVLFD